ncbi:MAG: DUF4347 domain-containing protein, partial [Planctomycetota bacterium]
MSKRQKQLRKKRQARKNREREHAEQSRQDEPSFTLEALEPRVLLSATWVDADAPDTTDTTSEDAQGDAEESVIVVPDQSSDADSGPSDVNGDDLFDDLGSGTDAVATDATTPEEAADADTVVETGDPSPITGDYSASTTPDEPVGAGDHTDPQPNDDQVAPSFDEAPPDSSDSTPAEEPEPSSEESTGEAADEPDDVAAAVPDETAAEPLKIVLIDSTLDDVDTLRASADSDATVIEYDGAHTSMVDILSQVESLSDSSGRQIASLSILSHGSGGEFDLGNDTVSTEMTAEQHAAWHSLADNFTEDGNIYAYGCNVVDGSGEGQSLINMLSSMTGTEVFASNDVTGAGGDWQLETVSRGGESELAQGAETELNLAALAGYDSALADYSESGFSGTQTFRDGGISFTVSVTGGGTIDFDYDGTTDTLTITDNDGTSSATDITITDNNGGLAIDNITLDSVVGTITSSNDIGNLTIDKGADFDAITVNGGSGSIGSLQFTHTVTSTISTINADVGSISTQKPLSGTTINVNGSVSSMSFGKPLNGSAISISGDLDSIVFGGSAGNSTIDAGQVEGTLTISGKYSHSETYASASAISYDGNTDTLTTVVPNNDPVVSAGSDVTVSEGASVTLDASGSSDADGDTLTYTWTQTGGSTVTLSDASASQPNFTAPEGVSNSTLTFQVAVNDGTTTSYDNVQVTVNADDDAPSASAGADQTVNEGTNVTLDASASSDPEGQGLTYTWTQTGGTNVTLSDASVAQPTF